MPSTTGENCDISSVVSSFTDLNRTLAFIASTMWVMRHWWLIAGHRPDRRYLPTDRWLWCKYV